MKSSRVGRLASAVLASLFLSAVMNPMGALAASPAVPGSDLTAPTGSAGIQITGTTTARSKLPHAGALPEAVPATAGGFSIRGKVTDQVGGGALASIYVEADSLTSNYWVHTTTGADGSYSLNGLGADDYVVFFGDQTGVHFNGFYSGGGVPVAGPSAASVTVTNATVTGVDAQLAPIGPWTISLQASSTSPATGSWVTITATTNHDISLTNFDMYIFRGDGQGWFCESGTTCHIYDSLYSPGSQSYSATVALPPNATSIQATSATTVVTWSGAPVGSTYTAISPTRVLDTRTGVGLSGPFVNHFARMFKVVGVPSNAVAVTGNLTVTGQTSAGYLFIGPVPLDYPTSSTLNFPVGDDRANAVTVALGPNSYLSLTFVAPQNGPSAQAIFDLTGYFTPDASGATYHALTPNRVLDTRDGTGGLSGPFSNHSGRIFQVAGGASGVPANATAVTGNLTVTGQTSRGYLYLGPNLTNNPTSSTLNFPIGDDRANSVTVQLGAGGTLSMTFVGSQNGPTADAIFDVTGYFTADLTGSTYFPLNPFRALDTRDGTGGLSTPFCNHVARSVTLAGVPLSTVAVTGNLTVTGQTSNGYLFLGPEPNDNPTSSTLNFPMGDDRANSVTVAVRGGSALSLTFVGPRDGPSAHAILDLTGYFAPAAG